MKQEEALKILEDTGAYQRGHFKLSSGLHSDVYVQCAQLLMHPPLAEQICRQVADLWQDEKPEMVVGPAIGGILVAYEVGRALNVPTIFAERQEGVMTLRRGFEPHVTKGLRVLVTEDVLTTGGSAQEVVELLQDLGADVIGAASIIDRTHGNTLKLTVPHRSLITLEAGTYQPDACPLCQEGLPINKPGSRPGI